MRRPFATHPTALACGVAALLALGTSCAGPTGPATVGPEGRVSISGRIQVRSAASAPRSYGLLQVVAPQIGDIKSVLIHLTRLGSGQPEQLMGLLPGASLPIELRNLRPNTAYKIRLSAEDGGSVSVDDPATDPNNPSLNLCETEVTTTNVLVQEDLTFRLKLKDVVFEGQANGNVQVSPGTLLAPEADEVATTSTANFLDLSAVSSPNLMLIRKDGVDYPATFGADGSVYVEFRPYGLSDVPMLSNSDFTACPTSSYAETMAYLDAPNERLVVSPFYFQSLPRLGYVGALHGGSVISLPVYGIENFIYACTNDH